MTEADADASSPPPAPPRLEDIVQPKILTRIVDARAPFPGLAVYAFSSRPQVGDHILVEIGPNQHASYRVQFLNYVPNRAVQIDIGCLPAMLAPGSSTNNLQAAADDLVDRNAKIYEKATTYSNGLIAVGYVGSLTIWSLYKSWLTKSGASVIALMLGFSLLIFITWELAMMIVRTVEIRRIYQRAEKPEQLAALAEEHRRLDRKLSDRVSRWWKLTLLPTIGFGYAAILLLLYNVAANLTGLPRWP